MRGELIKRLHGNMVTERDMDFTYSARGRSSANATTHPAGARRAQLLSDILDDRFGVFAHGRFGRPALARKHGVRHD